MAGELPVISSNAGGIPELNLDGVTGFTLLVGDVEGMAARALELLKTLITWLSSKPTPTIEPEPF
jgi:glycosyltransferase involved in cell wall biosynthesis